MYGDDAEGQVFNAAAAETRCFHASEQFCLGGEFSNGFNEILIAVPVFGDNLTHFGDQAVGIAVVDFGEEGFLHPGKFEAVEAPAGFEHAQRFGQRRVDMRDVAQAEGDGVDVGAFIGERQGFGVARHPAEIIGVASVEGAVAAHAQHFSVEIAERDFAIRPGFLADAKGDVACAARDVEIMQPLLRAYLADEMVFPEAVEAAGHDVVHDVISGCDGIEHADDLFGLGFRGYGFFAEPAAFGVLFHMNFLRLTQGEVTLKYIDIIMKSIYPAHMKTDDRKYLTLSGNPLHVPLWKTFHQSAGVRAGVLCGAFAVAADMVANNGALLPIVLPFALGAPVLAANAKMLESLFIDAAFNTNILCMPFKPEGKPLAIDTQPRADLRASDDLVSKARDTRNMALGCFAAVGAGTAGLLAELQSAIPDSMSFATALGVVAEVVAPVLATWTACAHRFNKVVKGEHVIVSAPPKRKTEEVPEPSGLKHVLFLG